MKKKSMLFLALLMIISSCEKDSDVPLGTISVKIDGAKKASAAI